MARAAAAAGGRSWDADPARPSGLSSSGPAAAGACPAPPAPGGRRPGRAPVSISSPSPMQAAAGVATAARRSAGRPPAPAPITLVFGSGASWGGGAGPGAERQPGPGESPAQPGPAAAAAPPGAAAAVVTPAPVPADSPPDPTADGQGPVWTDPYLPAACADPLRMRPGAAERAAEGAARDGGAGSAAAGAGAAEAGLFTPLVMQRLGPWQPGDAPVARIGDARDASLLDRAVAEGGGRAAGAPAPGLFTPMAADALRDARARTGRPRSVQGRSSGAAVPGAGHAVGRGLQTLTGSLPAALSAGDAQAPGQALSPFSPDMDLLLRGLPTPAGAGEAAAPPGATPSGADQDVAASASAAAASPADERAADAPAGDQLPAPGGAEPVACTTPEMHAIRALARPPLAWDAAFRDAALADIGAAHGRVGPAAGATAEPLNGPGDGVSPSPGPGPLRASMQARACPSESGLVSPQRWLYVPGVTLVNLPLGTNCLT